jgi:hypothetical protein
MSNPEQGRGKDKGICWPCLAVTSRISAIPGPLPSFHHLGATCSRLLLRPTHSPTLQRCNKHVLNRMLSPFLGQKALLVSCSLPHNYFFEAWMSRQRSFCNRSTVSSTTFSGHPPLMDFASSPPFLCYDALWLRSRQKPALPRLCS